LECTTLTFIRFKTGLGSLFKRLWFLRFELVNLELKMFDVEDSERIIESFNSLSGPVMSSIKRRALVTIFSYHIVGNYRGWKYIRNLPINGQRTWTNAWTAYRCNILLKALILKRGKKFYGNLQKSEIYTAYMAEYVNLKWKTHWYPQWAYGRALRIFDRRQKHLYKIDLYSMAKGHIVTKKRFDKLTKKQKAQHNTHNHTLGFSPGFTIGLLRRLFKLRARKRSARGGLILNKGDLKVKKIKRVKKKNKWKN
jgi:ribosomal protein S13